MGLSLGEYIGQCFAPDSFSHLRNVEILGFSREGTRSQAGISLKL